MMLPNLCPAGRLGRKRCRGFPKGTPSSWLDPGGSCSIKRGAPGQSRPENGPKLSVAINSLTRSAALASEIEYQQLAAANEVISS
jgi:hypothetical protein